MNLMVSRLDVRSKRGEARRHFSSPNQGFTIIELLIVIVVIGVLATITIVLYNGIVKQVAQASLKSDLDQSSKQLSIDRTNNSTFPTSLSAANNGNGIKVSPGTSLEYTSDGNTYCLTGSSAAAQSSYYVSDSSGAVASGVCVGHTGYRSTQPSIATVVSGGTYHTCAIASSRLYCWGDNSDGQLGNGNNTTSSIPSLVDTTGVLAGKTITALSSGGHHACVLASGRPYCWGQGNYGQLGNNLASSSNVPVAVDNTGVLSGKAITAIAAGGYHTCVIASGQPYCWGAAGFGRLGNGMVSGQSNVPIAVDTTGVLSGKTITAIAPGTSHTCAIASDQAAYCWGLNNNYQIGNPSVSGYTAVPVAVDTTTGLAGKTVTIIASGVYHTCAVASGQMYCWGNNGYGQIGNNTTAMQASPAAVTTSGVLGGKNISSVTVGYYHTCAVASGQVYCWGYNGFGSVGNSSSVDVSAPVAVDTSGFLYGKTVTAIGRGDYHTCAVASGQIFCWGWNNNSQLGSTVSGQSSVPVPVQMP